MANHGKWMIYGAGGYTGQLIARKALAHGLRPILAGRDQSQIEALGRDLTLPWCTFKVGDKKSFQRNLTDVSLLVNAAGPFTHTAIQMAEACVANGINYIDISNEVASLVAVYTLDGPARDKNVLLLPGLGFAPTASNCLVKHLHTLLPEANWLDIVLEPFTRFHSAGASRTMMEAMAAGGFYRRDGKLERYRLGNGCKSATLPTGVRTLVPAPLGDTEAAFRCTGIPNITAHIVSSTPPFVAGVGLSIAQAVMSSSVIRSILLERTASGNGKHSEVSGPAEGRGLVWARIMRTDSASIDGWLYTGEGYDFTASAVVSGVNRILNQGSDVVGAHTPANAFGPDFVLEMPRVERKISSPQTWNESLAMSESTG